MRASDTFDDLVRAAEFVEHVVDRIADDQWTSPTPCTQWCVRDVVGHLVGMNLVFAALFENSPPPERGIDRLGVDPAGALRRSGASLRAAASRPGVLDRVQTTRVGAASGLERLQWRIVDLLAHGWDLCQAIGVTPDVPDDLVEQAVILLRASLPGQMREGRFDDPQPVDADAPAIDRLAALTGRPVPWAPEKTRGSRP